MLAVSTKLRGLQERLERSGSRRSPRPTPARRRTSSSRDTAPRPEVRCSPAADSASLVTPCGRDSRVWWHLSPRERQTAARPHSSNASNIIRYDVHASTSSYGMPCASQNGRTILRAGSCSTRDGREQVMLDLVVQPAEQEVRQRARRDVARADDLALQERQLLDRPPRSACPCGSAR